MRVYAGPPLEVPDVNLVQVLFRTAKENPERDAYLVRDAARKGEWTHVKWSEVEARVRALANGLLSLGLKKGDRIAIIADTRPEWSLADYATLAVGGVTVTVFPTLIPDQIRYLLEDSGSRVVFVENEAQFAKIREIAEHAKSVEHYVTIDPVEPGDGTLAKRTMTFTALEDAGRAFADANAGALDARVAEVAPDDLATIIYTSGTTGVPKGAMLTHRNIVASAKASVKAIGLRKHMLGFGFLPLAHSYQRQSQFVFTEIAATAAFSNPKTLAEDLASVKPEIMVSVPRLYERMYDQILAKVGEAPERRQRIFHAAADVARAYGRAISDSGKPDLALRFKHAVFDKLVYSKLRDALGFTNLELCGTGAAAIRPDLLHFFQGIGVCILEGYGLTETIAPSNANPPHRFRPGTVGPVYPGMEQAIDEDGEVLMRGPNVFIGYWQKPEENDACFVELNGQKWFRTGDIGAFDDAGYLKIVDRKKEIEVLDTGKNVAPLPIEERLKESPVVSEALVVASERKFVGCLIQPNYDALVQWAKKEGVPFDEKAVVVQPDPTGAPMTYAVGRDLLEHPRVQALFAEAVEKTNNHFADFERVKAFRLVAHAWTMDRNELTPTMKKKRRVIKENHADLLEEMFTKPR